MTIEQRQEIELKAIQMFGQFPQMDIAIEEMAELTKELCKFKRGFNNREHIIEEYADVLICLNQIKMMLGIKNAEVESCMDAKLTRLARRIEKVKNQKVNDENEDF